jgi:hypothetical protein
LSEDFCAIRLNGIYFLSLISIYSALFTERKRRILMQELVRVQSLIMFFPHVLNIRDRQMAEKWLPLVTLVCYWKGVLTETSVLPQDGWTGEERMWR